MRDYPTKSLSAGSDLLSELCVSVLVRGKLKRIQGRKHLKAAPPFPAAASQAVFDGELR